MRRRRRDLDGVPPLLWSFVVADWSGSRWEALAAWRLARRTWAEGNGGWPGGPLAMMRDESDARRRLEGLPLLPFDRTPEELAALNGVRYDRRRRSAS